MNLALRISAVSCLSSAEVNIGYCNYILLFNICTSVAYRPNMQCMIVMNDVCVMHGYQPEATSFSRMTRYIELLVKDAAWFGAGSTGDFVRTPFHSFCDIIENEGCQPWVAEELRTELKTERGEMAIEEYIRKEVRHLQEFTDHAVLRPPRKVSINTGRRMQDKL